MIRHQSVSRVLWCSEIFWILTCFSADNIGPKGVLKEVGTHTFIKLAIDMSFALNLAR